MSTALLLAIATASIVILLLLVIKAKVHPFVALLIVSLLVAIATGIPAEKIMETIITGMGGLLGHITIIIVLGAMLGAIIEASGGAESLAQRFSKTLGLKRTVAALTMAAFILGIPVFFEVGFIIVIPLIYGFTKVARVSPLKFGLPMAGVMLTVHVALPTHPGAAAAAGILHTDMGWLMILGIAISVPVGIIGYYVAKFMNRRHYPLSVEVLEQLQMARPEGQEKKNEPAPPGALTISGLIVVPIVLIVLGTLSHTLLAEGSLLRSVMTVIGTPPIALLIALGLAAWLLGVRRGWSKDKLEDLTGRAIPTSASVILVAGAGGAFGKVLVESGVGKALAVTLETLHLPLVPAAFILSLALRASQGSATVAILTTSGLLTQAVTGVTDMQRVLVTLAACFGGLGLSHVNDAGFWVVTRYLGLSVADGLRTWTVLTTLMGLSGFALTWLAWTLL
ncbi:MULTISPECIES: GntP family transporter [Pantoea]|jgi:GntP family gluconate:H+ symporter|uniref:GntP family transporter n=1 Tax=Enterobacter agglomerans TaxID=549 RepID=A0ACC5PN38_ENTAG|nr:MULTISPECIES: GntP family transporter [Pantoea]MBD8126328.1 GntP family transporter [Pantoea agglomerans]MBD8154619.1 GntP family transporter [Pantoea agglomerans]MBD8241241.1 GntP family transporter [Pantoea agglomerans]MBN1089313.1 GntP family transporter [Pantoea sp. 1B4]NEH18713.1 GntP family transporter [Pantoea agglomerans]